MYKLAALTILATSALSVVRAAVPLYGQCGGLGFTGDTECEPPATCYFHNYWISQCLILSTAGSASSTTTGTITTSPSSTTTTTSTKTAPATTTAACQTGLPSVTPLPVRARTANTTFTGMYLHQSIRAMVVLGTTNDGKPCQVVSYLNIKNELSAPNASYKGLYWELNHPVSNFWSNVPLSLTSASPWGAKSWFMACKDDTSSVELYLQTGSDTPPGQTCVMTQIS
ncbi:hypothetical protein FS837_001485 [Tulasnella sp. UAMH 9824]|nr:hypothetical protein FS837_001485 [Tulasnella sp. UAMH 9824]